MQATFFVRGADAVLSGDTPEEFWANMERYADRYIKRLEFANFDEFYGYLYICPDEFEYAIWPDAHGAIDYSRERGIVGGWQQVTF